MKLFDQKHNFDLLEGLAVILLGVILLLLYLSR